MGTSTGYQMPTGGEWTPVKKEVAKFAKQGLGVGISPSSILRNYLRASGGSEGIARGSGHGGSGGSGSTGGGAGGRGSVVRTARGLGGFLNRVGAAGLGEALREMGMAHLIGRSSTEIASALLDKLAGPASTLDEAAVRSALADLNDELLGDAETFKDVERVLTESLDRRGISRIIGSFFGHYIFRRFLRDFYERLIKAVGSVRAAGSLDEIKDYIDSALRAKLVNRDITGINWYGTEGNQITGDILSETVAVFGVA